jgi:hypothetical protein
MVLRLHLVLELFPVLPLSHSAVRVYRRL